jgi:hypothetical protein
MGLDATQLLTDDTLARMGSKLHTEPDEAEIIALLREVESAARAPLLALIEALQAEVKQLAADRANLLATVIDWCLDTPLETADPQHALVNNSAIDDVGAP